MGATWRRRAIAAAALLGAAAWAARDVPTAIGAAPAGRRADRIRRSPSFRGGAFRNPEPATTFPPGSGRTALREAVAARHRRVPSVAIPVRSPSQPRPGSSPPGRLFLTWYGHATTLVELDGKRILVDPVWGERCSPSALVGPRRLHRPPVPLRQLPPIDAVVISHDHYDHLDAATARALIATSDAPFVVPLGVGAHLERWGAPANRIVELDWHESVEVGEVTLTATPARHFSGRGLRRDNTLWASWALRGSSRRIFYSGDTGYSDLFREVGNDYGPFDATLMQIGAYSPAWPDIHLTPEDGVRVHQEVRGGLLVPVHWATFSLAFHGWADPVDRLWREAKANDIRLAVPRPGERIDVDDPAPLEAWWDSLI